MPIRSVELSVRRTVSADAIPYRRRAVLALSSGRGGVDGQFRTIGKGADEHVVFFVDSSPTANPATRAAFHRQQARGQRFLASNEGERGRTDKASDRLVRAKMHDDAAEAHEKGEEALRGKPSPVGGRPSTDAEVAEAQRPGKPKPAPATVGDRVTLPTHTGAPGDGRNYGTVRDAEVVRSTPKARIDTSYRPAFGVG